MGYEYKEWERGVGGGAVMQGPTVVDTYEGLLATIVAQEGAITRKELQYNGARQGMPVPNVPLGLTGLVHIYGKYQAAGAKQMTMRWTVRDPNGTMIESYQDSDTWPYTPPGSEHHFAGGGFNLDKPGNWTIKAELLM